MNTKLARNLLIGTLTLSTAFNAFADIYEMSKDDYLKENFFSLTDRTGEENKVYLYNAAEQYPEGSEVIKTEGVNIDNSGARQMITFIFDADKFEEGKQYIFNNPFANVDTTLYIKGTLKNSTLKAQNTLVYIERVEGNSFVSIDNDSVRDEIDLVDAYYSNRVNAVIGYIGPDACISAAKDTYVLIQSNSSETSNDEEQSETYKHPSTDKVIFSY